MNNIFILQYGKRTQKATKILTDMITGCTPFATSSLSLDQTIRVMMNNKDKGKSTGNLKRYPFTTKAKYPRCDK